jgi:hypothetical protein
MLSFHRSFSDELFASLNTDGSETNKLLRIPRAGGFFEISRIEYGHACPGDSRSGHA